MTGSIAIEGPVEGLPEFFDAGLLFLLPGAGGGKSHPQPADVEQVLTHVIPIAAEHSDCPVFLAVTDKASDVDHVVAEIREDPGRPECSRSHEERNAVPAELREVIFVIVQRKILPGDRHGIVRKDREVDVRLVRGHVCPEEDLFVLYGRKVHDPLHVMEEGSVKPHFLHHRATLPETELESFIATDVDESAPEVRNDFTQIVIEKGVGAFDGRADYLAARTLRNVIEATLAKSVVHVSQAFLLRNEFDVVFPGIFDKLADFFRSHDCAAHVDLRVLLRLEYVLGVDAVAVDLVLREDADLLLDIFDGGNRPAVPVVLDPAVPESRSICDPGGTHPEIAFGVGICQLTESLDAVEYSGRRPGADDYFLFVGQKHIGLV